MRHYSKSLSSFSRLTGDQSMSNKWLITSLIPILIATGFAAEGKTLYKYNSEAELCGAIGRGSYWSAYVFHPGEPAHWAGYLKMHLDFPISIAKHGMFDPPERDVEFVVIKIQSKHVATALVAHLGDNVCLTGRLNPILAGRWTASVAESVSFDVSGFAPDGNASPRHKK